MDVVKYVNEIRIDGEVFYTDVNDNAKDYTDMEVYATNNFDDSFEGSISEITAFTKVTLNDVFALMADVGLARTDTRTRRRI